MALSSFSSKLRCTIGDCSFALRPPPLAPVRSKGESFPQRGIICAKTTPLSTAFCEKTVLLQTLQHKILHIYRLVVENRRSSGCSPGRKQNCKRRLYCTSILHNGAAAKRERQRVRLAPNRQRGGFVLEYFDRSTGPMGLHQSLFFVLHRPRRFSFSCEKKRRGVDTVPSSFPCAQEKKKWGARSFPIVSSNKFRKYR